MTTKEAKAAKTSVLSGWFGLVFGVSVTKSTGASAFQVSPTTSTDWTTFYHFCPHLTPKGFTVNKKV